jgi:TonB family protein
MNKGRNSGAGIGSSIAAHLAILAFLISIRHQTWKVFTPQVRGGEHSILYWQGAAQDTGAQGSAISPRSKVDKNPLHPRQKPVPASHSQGGPTASPNSFGGSQTGSEDITPAYPVIYPSPHIADRSLLPPGNRNVIVDVNVSAQGDVLSEKLVQGLGNSADQIVLDTVKSWKFHPASSNGSAVASVAELIFPLSPKWNG